MEADLPLLASLSAALSLGGEDVFDQAFAGHGHSSIGGDDCDDASFPEVGGSSTPEFLATDRYTAPPQPPLRSGDYQDDMHTTNWDEIIDFRPLDPSPSLDLLERPPSRSGRLVHRPHSPESHDWSHGPNLEGVLHHAVAAPPQLVLPPAAPNSPPSDKETGFCPLEPSPVSQAGPRPARKYRKHGSLTKSETSLSQRRERQLERNRVAAARCRQKKNAWSKGLQDRASKLARRNAALAGQVDSLKDEALHLKEQMLAHTTCRCGGIRQYLHAQLAAACEQRLSRNGDKRGEGAAGGPERGLDSPEGLGFGITGSEAFAGTTAAASGLLSPPETSSPSLSLPAAAVSHSRQRNDLNCGTPFPDEGVLYGGESPDGALEALLGPVMQDLTPKG